MATPVSIPVDLRNPRVATLAGNAFFNVRGLTAYDAGFWELVKDVDGKFYGYVSIPRNVAATPNGKIREIIQANATTGVTRLNIASAAVAVAESLNPGSLTAETAQNVTVPGTARDRKDVIFTLTPTLTAGDLLIVEFFHEGSDGGDTLAVNTELVMAFLDIDVK